MPGTFSPHSVLFICTGNVFRSVAAEYALKARLAPEMRRIVGSAGIEAKPQSLHPMIIEYLCAKGADPSAHVQRKLTRELLESVDLAVAMGFDHRDFVRQHFGLEVPLFNQVCFEKEEPVLDIHEAIPDWQSNMDATRIYVQSVVDHIWNAAPVLLARLPSFIVGHRHTPRSKTH